MAFTVGEQIMQAVEAAMSNPANNPPAKTYRTRVSAFAGKEIPAFVLYAVSEDMERVSEHIVRCTRKFQIECLVRTVQPPVDPFADPLILYVISSLMADESLGGLAKHMNPVRVQWESELAFEAVGVALMDFDVVYLTRVDDPTVRM